MGPGSTELKHEDNRAAPRTIKSASVPPVSGVHFDTLGPHYPAILFDEVGQKIIVTTVIKGVHISQQKK